MRVTFTARVSTRRFSARLSSLAYL